MIKTFFAAFSLAGLATKLSVIAVAVLTLGPAYGIWHYKVWSRGYDRALADIAKQDQKAIARATQYRGAVLDCRARGMRWDQTSGQCSGR
jgi:hypothetical protein